MHSRSLVTLALVAGCFVGLAGCGGGKSSSPSSLEAALGVKQVAGLFAGRLDGVLGPVCTPAAIAGNFSCSAQPILGACAPSTTGPCASPLAPAKVWFDCFPDTGGTVKWDCQLVSPPPGVPVFTTRAQKAAPKHAVWTCKTFNADHERIGPVLIVTNDPHGPKEQRGGAMTIESAQLLAKQLGLKLTNGC